MAATQQATKQPKHPKHPAKQPPRKVRNDFLARMLQLEKQSMVSVSPSDFFSAFHPAVITTEEWLTPLKHHRSASASPPHGHIEQPPPSNENIHHPPSTQTAHIPSLVSPDTQKTSPLISPRVHQTQTLSPTAAQNGVKTHVKPAPLRVETRDIPQDPPQSDICLSPSWLGHAEREQQKEKKKQDKDQRDQQRRQQEDNRQPPKRLSKKPPAAMDTQKMPAELRKPRRNSLLSFVPSRSSSRDRSQDRSKDEKRKSGSSITSFVSRRRSNSTSRRPTISPEEEKSLEPESPGSWKPVVNPIPPRLPSLRFSQKKFTSNNSKSATPTSTEEESDGELLAFPYGSDRPIAEKLPESPKKSSRSPAAEAETNKLQQSSEKLATTKSSVPTPPKPSDIPQRKSDESKILSGPPRGIEVLPSPPKPWTQPNKQNKSRQNSDEVAAELIAMLSEQKLRPYQHASPPASPQGPKATSRDGGSYVHKQRMYEQQRSIAGFQEQQALQMYHDQAAVGDNQETSKDVQSRKSDGGTSPMRLANAHSSSPSAARSWSGSRSASSPPASPSSNRRHSASPSGRASLPPAQTALSPLKQVSSAPDDDLEEEQFKLLKKAENAAPDKEQTKKSEKFFGLRRRTKELPAPIHVPDTNGHLSPAQKNSSERTKEHEAAPKQSRRDRMSAHIPFTRHRASSSNSQIAIVDGSQADTGPGHSKTRASSQAPRSPSAISVTEETRSKMIEQALEQKKSSSESNSTQESKDGVNGRQATADKPSTKRPSAKPSQNSEELATAYGELIHGSSSEESVYHDVSENDEPQSAVKLSSKVRTESDTPIKRPRSDLQLQKQNIATQSLPSLDFLPQLKHQPLTKNPKRSQPASGEPSPTKIKIPKPANLPDTTYRSPLASPPDIALLPRSPLRSSSNLPALIKNQSATSITSLSSSTKNTPSEGGSEAKPIGKLFVICCKCKFWHDLPAKLYEAMALPKELHRNDEKSSKGKAQPGKNKVATARLETAVKCPWCEHPMTTACCAGWTTVVYMHERHH
ncbi:uncharacterized protein KY384_001609 [Bacidia gigantensis]|uniref:uncharacterized protein n=1 Tax=Bacidia gigantensis TaxID=2732470 RepID=UPI001D05503D|nr:uncharacterized protein KY384_001609 [Bacidia gigantensis]KAG8533868.1 hypothetical protein KY384_001609 [Bacidia gigantensis]